VPYAVGVRFSRVLALAAGFVLPAIETARRWNELGDIRLFPFWFDDWIIGLFLLYGFWRTRTDVTAGRPALAAAWGFACGMGYASFFSQLYELSSPDPSGLQSITVVTIKGVMLAIATVALILTLRSEK
jgi:hypothetical protein